MDQQVCFRAPCATFAGFDAVLSPASVKVASITLQWLDIVQRTSVNTQDQ